MRPSLPFPFLPSPSVPSSKIALHVVCPRSTYASKRKSAIDHHGPQCGAPPSLSSRPFPPVSFRRLPFFARCAPRPSLRTDTGQNPFLLAVAHPQLPPDTEFLRDRLCDGSVASIRSRESCPPSCLDTRPSRGRIPRGLSIEIKRARSMDTSWIKIQVGRCRSFS